MKKFDFAKSYKELEEIAARFERGDLSLEEGLKKFEQGLELVAECKKYLKQVENKIIEIIKKFSIKE